MAKKKVSEPRSVGLIVGMQGSGKSHFVKNEIIPNARPPVFILDPMAEYSQGVIFDDMLDLMHYLVSGKVSRGGVHVVRVQSDEQRELFFEVFRELQKPCTLIIEEADMSGSVYKINDDYAALLKYGRHWNISLINITQRAAQVHKTITSQANFIVSFKQVEQRDIKRLQETYQEADDLINLKLEPEKQIHEYKVLTHSMPRRFKSILENEADLNGKYKPKSEE